jgi:hypothetical protein
MIIRCTGKPQTVLYCDDQNNNIYEKVEKMKVYFEQRPTIIVLEIEQYEEEIIHDEKSYKWTFFSGMYQGFLATIGVRTDTKRHSILIFTQLI